MENCAVVIQKAFRMRERMCALSPQPPCRPAPARGDAARRGRLRVRCRRAWVRLRLR